MSREVHSGPTDQTQARGEPFRGDPEGGDVEPVRRRDVQAGDHEAGHRRTREMADTQMQSSPMPECKRSSIALRATSRRSGRW